ncbi:MAG TPA: DHHA1 domain-containing protein [Clostridia bacterium]|nr:DHHA1 domain-containing protein [Clostridia bacterium]
MKKFLEERVLKRYVSALAQDREGLLAVFSPEEDGYNFLMVSSGEDINSLGKDLLKEFGGKGGGRGVNFQGWIPAEEDSDKKRERIHLWFKKSTQK